MNDIIIENAQFTLIVGSDCIVKSLVSKNTGLQCSHADEDVSLFSVTQERPFNNEVKLAHPNKRTTFQANSLMREGNRLIVGFEVIPYKAAVDITFTDNYITFTLADFIVGPKDYDYLKMTPPPVAEMRILQLPVRSKKYFGEWLNVCWDEQTAVNVLATSPHARIDSERRKNCRIMTADAVKGIKLKGTGASLIVCDTDKLLVNIERLEADYGLPNGVESRRGDKINASYYWTGGINLSNADEHITYAKAGGFRLMLIYYTAIFEHKGYGLNGNYDYSTAYPNGKADLAALLNKIKAAGISPGFHFLQTHIGLQSRYVTPVADHRLNVTTRFSLARPFGAHDDTIYTEQNPDGAVMADGCRVLKIGGELVTYEGYISEAPYRFIGIEHGAYSTNVGSYPAGAEFGILDISEFGATSCYIDQNTSLQDEVADKIADAYNAGFEFVYFDGSEGTNPPFEYHVPNAQYRVYKKLGTAPLFTEGAAKAHFSWHFLTGGNAFDIFPPEIFKDMIRKFPAEEAPRMRMDFTRLNFGWWSYSAPGTQPDMFEFATSRAAAWDCPIALMENTENFRKHSRTADNLEVLRRWEDVRAKKWLTEEQKAALKNLDQEHILIINEDGAYELIPYDEVKDAADGDKNVRVFLFERRGYRYAVYWHATGDGKFMLPLAAPDVMLTENFKDETAPKDMGDGRIIVPISHRRYLKTALNAAQFTEALKQAALR